MKILTEYKVAPRDGEVPSWLYLIKSGQSVYLGWRDGDPIGPLMIEIAKFSRTPDKTFFPVVEAKDGTVLVCYGLEWNQPLDRTLHRLIDSLTAARVEVMFGDGILFQI